MSQRRVVALAILAMTSVVSPTFAAKPVPADKAPSAMIFGSFINTPAYESVPFPSATSVAERSISVSETGAWFFGDVNEYALDCAHHYEAQLAPTDGGYIPFFTLGANGLADDAMCGQFNRCITCSVDYGGQKWSNYYTTDTYPAYLPPGEYTVSLRSLNGGGAGDSASFWLAQVDQDAFESMTMYQPVSDSDCVPHRKTWSTRSYSWAA